MPAMPIEELDRLILNYVHGHRPKGRSAPKSEDSRILDWLEDYVNKHGAILLHDGSYAGVRPGETFNGIGMRPGALNRTLRQAVTLAMGRS